MEQYRKLRLVLPNINSRGKISKQVGFDIIHISAFPCLIVIIGGGGGRGYPIY